MLIVQLLYYTILRYAMLCSAILYYTVVKKSTDEREVFPRILKCLISSEFSVFLKIFH